MLSTNPIVVLMLFVLMTVAVLLCFQSTVFCVVMMVAERRREERHREPILHDYCIVAAPEDEPCSICLEPMEGTSAELHCKHAFHEACLQQWKTQNCPLCRASTKEHTVA
jgi:hypothetical protein